MYSIPEPKWVTISKRKVWPREITVDGVPYAVKPLATFSYNDDQNIEFHELYEKMDATNSKILAVFYSTDPEYGDHPVISRIIFEPLAKGEKCNWCFT